jgi:hypothetical protein
VTGDAFSNALEDDVDVTYRYHAKCPFCHNFQIMEFENIHWGDSREPKAIQRKKLAFYSCTHCGMDWNDAYRDDADKDGKWFSENDMERPSSIAFHLPSWYSPFISLSDVAAAFLKGLHDPKKMQAFVTQHKAEPWKEVVEQKDETQILSHKTDLQVGIVPEWAVALTAGIDMQKHGFWFVVRAWDKDLRSHLVQYGSLSNWSDVEALVFGTQYKIEKSDKSMGIWRAALDTGGGLTDDDDWSRTEEAYQWLRDHSQGRIFGIKGSSRQQIQRVRKSIIDRFPNKNKKIPGGLELRMIDTSQFKGIIHWRLTRKEGETQRFTLHSDTGIDYAKQILAEELRKGRHGKKEWKQIRKDNHLLDCFDPKTELLTRNGWVQVSEITLNDECATVHLETDQIKYQKPYKVISRKHEGQMIHINGKRIDILVTPNHRMIVYKKIFDNSNKKWVFEKEPTVVLANELTIWDRIKLTAKWEGVNSRVKIPASFDKKRRMIQPEQDIDAEDFALLLGWYVSEGHCFEGKSKTQGNNRLRVHISQNQGTKFDEIASLLSRLPWKWHISGGRQFTITSKQLFHVVQQCGVGVKNKKVPEWIKNASPNIIKKFLYGAISGDGWIQGTFRTYSTVSKQLADDIQELFLKSGFSSNIVVRPSKPYLIKGRYSENTVPQYFISECKTKAASLRSGKNNPNFSMIEYSGMVHCVSVPNSTVVCRRNGKMFIAGNCEVYAAACADGEWTPALAYLAKNTIKEDQISVKQQPNEQESAQRSRPSWFKNR